MGIFDKVFKIDNTKASDLKLSNGESFLAIMLSAVASDQIVAKDEMLLFLNLLSRFKGLESVSKHQFEKMIDRFQKIINRDGVGTLVDAAKKGLKDDMKETAFANAVEIVLADGYVDTKEKEFLEHLQKAVEISDERAQTIIEVIMIKNRGTTSDIFSSGDVDNMFYN